MSTFNWHEGVSKTSDIVKAIATELTGASAHKWDLVFPASTNDIQDKAILKTTTTFNLTVYLKLERPTVSMNAMYLTLSNKLNSAGDDLDDEIISRAAKFSWYREKDEVTLYDWTAIQFWMSFSEDFINIVIQGDPSLDSTSYSTYLISYAYIGALKSFKGADEDKDYNFGLTVSSDTFDPYTQKYGNRTASCITDMGMLGTRTGTPFQAHLPKFSTTGEFIDKHIITSGQWTHKFPFSNIIMCHAYDGDRGNLQNVLIGDRSAIFHLDILKHTDEESGEEWQFQAFNINAPYSILNNGANVFYGIVIRKS